MLLTLVLSSFFVLFGIIHLLYKPYYNENKYIDFKKTTVAQGLLLLALGTLIYPVYIISRKYNLHNFFPYILILIIIIFVYIFSKTPKWFTDKDLTKHFSYNRDKYQKHTVVYKKYIFLIIIIVTVISLKIASLMPNCTIEDDKLEINGIFGIEKKMDEIIIIDTINTLPKIESIDNGISIFKKVKGDFYINQNEKAKMFVYKKQPLYIYIEYKRANKLYINFKDPQETKEFYKKLKVKKEKGAQF